MGTRTSVSDGLQGLSPPRSTGSGIYRPSDANTDPVSFPAWEWGYDPRMELSLLLIVIGIVLAIFVNYAIGIACILIGLVLLIWPRISAGRTSRV